MAASRHHHHLASHPICLCPSLRPFLFHGRRTSMETKPAQGIHPQLWRQTRHEIQVVQILLLHHQPNHKMGVQGIIPCTPILITPHRRMCKILRIHYLSPYLAKPALFPYRNHESIPIYNYRKSPAWNAPYTAACA